MKNTVLLIIVFLAGCSLFPSKFDSSLYDHLITLSMVTDQAVTKCGTADEPAIISTLNLESKLLVKYITYTSTDLTKPVQLVDKAITEMNNAYVAGTPSTAYCKLKLEIIDDDLKQILKAVGGKDK